MSARDRRAKDRRKKATQVAKERRAKPRRKGRDRREETRVPMELWMEELAGDDVYFRRTGNVSEGGVFFDKAIPHPLGTMVTLKFGLPGDGEMVVARGRVVSAAGSNDGLGMGVKFIHIEGNGQKRIRDHIRKSG